MTLQVTREKPAPLGLSDVGVESFLAVTEGDGPADGTVSGEGGREGAALGA